MRWWYMYLLLLWNLESVSFKRNWGKQPAATLDLQDSRDQAMALRFTAPHGKSITSIRVGKDHITPSRKLNTYRDEWSCPRSCSKSVSEQRKRTNKQTNRASASFPCRSASQRLRFFFWAHTSSGSSREVAGLLKYWAYTLIQILWEMQASGISPASCNSSRQEPKLPLPFLGTWSSCLRYPAPGNRSFFPESEERMDYFLPSEIAGCVLALVGGSQLWRKSWSPAMHQNLCLRCSSELNTSCSSP